MTHFTELLKDKLKWVYALLLMAGIIFGVTGLAFGFPIIAALGNSSFIAGYFTPVVFTKKIPFKDAIFGGLWTFTIVYFVQSEDIAGIYLWSVIPFFILSVFLSKWAGAWFVIRQS